MVSWFPLPWVVILPFIAAPAGWLLGRLPRWGGGAIVALIPLLLFSRVVSSLPAITMGSPLQVVWPWVRGLGIPFSLRLDGVSFVFALFTCGIGTLVLLSSQALPDNKEQAQWFFFRVLITIGTILGIILAEHAITLVVFWNLIPLILLITLTGPRPGSDQQSHPHHHGDNHDYRITRRIASQSFMVLLMGSVAVLVGLLLLAEATRRSGIPMGQIFSFQGMLSASSRIKETPLYAPSLLLLLIGCAAYAGLFPFSFWLPRVTMIAPTLISGLWCALLPSATGVYLLIRLTPILGGTVLWSILLILIGTITMLIGAILALYQHHPSGLLTWGAISSVGMLTIGIGLGGDLGATSVVVGVFNHVLAIGALFLILALVGTRGETTDVRMPTGGWAIFPLTTTLALLALVAMAGGPGSTGFIARDALFEAGIFAIRSHSPLLPLPISYLALASVIVSSGVTIGYTWRLFRFFIGGNPALASQYLEAPRLLLVTVGVLVGILGWGGLGGLSTVQHALEPMARAIVAPAPFLLYLNHWNGIKPSLLLNILVCAIGFIIIFFVPYIIQVRWPMFARFSIDQLSGNLSGLIRMLAAFSSRWFQGGKLRTYLAMIMSVWIALIGTIASFTALHHLNRFVPAAIWSDLLAHQQALFPLLLIPIGVAMILRSQSRLEATMALGLVGVLLATFFALSGAPELAILQLLIQGIITVIFLNVFSVLPARLRIYSRYRIRVRDALIGVGVGSVMGLVAIVATLFPDAPPTALPTVLSDIPPATDRDAFFIHARSFDGIGVLVVVFLAMLGIVRLLRGPRGGVMGNHDGSGDR